MTSIGARGLRKSTVPLLLVLAGFAGDSMMAEAADSRVAAALSAASSATPVAAPVASAVAAQGRYVYRSYGADQGLSNVGVLRLVQDRDGFIWAGTEDGLYRYDGYRFDGFGLKEGLLSTSIDALFEDPSGVLWVGTHAGLSRRDGQRFTPIGVNKGVPEITITGIARSAEGLWVTTAQGPLVGDANDQFKALQDWPGGEATAIFGATKTPAVWVARWTGAAGMVVRRDGRWQRFDAPAGAPQERVDAIVEDANGDIWARTPTSLWRLRHDATHFELAPTPIALSSSRGYMAIGNRGDVYVSTDEALLHRVGERWEMIDRMSGLPGAPWPVMEDREGSLWIGSVGLHRLLGRGVFRAFTTAEGLPYDVVWSIYRDRAKRLWIGTSHGLAVWDGMRFDTIEGTEPNTIRSIVEARDGTLYMAGVPGNEILTYSPATHTLRRRTLIDNNPAKRIFRLLIARDGSLWASTDGAGLFRADTLAENLRFEPVDLPNGSPQEYMSDVREDAQGRIWVAGQHGLALLEHDRWRRFTSKDGLRRDYLAYVRPLSNGDLLLPYFDPLGVARARYSNGRLQILRHYDAKSTNSADKVFLVGEDSLQRIWIGGGKGIDLVTATGTRHFGAADGLIGEDTASMSFLADDDGDVWFGTTKGLIHFDQQAFAALPPPQPPVTALMRIRLGDKSYLPDARNIRVPSDNTFEVHFAGTSFIGEGTLQYRERLLGRELSFNVTDSRDARYSALPYGHYRFEVAARVGPRGQWGPTSAFEFDVAPAWWQTWWFRGLALIGVLLVLMLASRWRVAHLRRENLRLEDLVEARTHDLKLANVALEESNMIDPLTGLKNRRYLKAFMPEEVAWALRQRRASQRRASQLLALSARDWNIDLCLMMVDLDHFKAVNDQYGHTAGDLVLQQVGAVMLAACRSSDVVVRWGGEEFLIVGRNTNRYQASVLARQVCAAIRAHPFEIGHGIVLSMTCSMGFTAFPMCPSDPTRFSWEQAVKLADHCLYAAKKTGRDGWVGCLLKDDKAPNLAAANLHVVHDVPGFGPCLVVSSWPDAQQVRWE
jgi:diguanylate cyclase (GGDEF)-like protein